MTSNNKSLKSGRQVPQVAYKVGAGLVALALLANLGILIHFLIAHQPLFWLGHQSFRVETFDSSYIASWIYQSGLVIVFFAFMMAGLSGITKNFCSGIVVIGSWCSLLGLALMANNFTPLYLIYGFGYRCWELLFVVGVTFYQMVETFDGPATVRKRMWKILFFCAAILLNLILCAFIPEVPTQ